MRRILPLMLIFLFLSSVSIFAQSQQLENGESAETIVAYQADNFKDPFMPEIKKEEQPAVGNLPGRAELALPEFTVQGMIWDTANPQAIIDGQILRLGDEVKDAKIIEISKEGVKLLFKGRIITAKPKIGENRFRK